jgi:hypothetical protein
MREKLMLPSDGTHFLNRLQRPNGPAPHIGSLLNRNEPCLWLVPRYGSDCSPRLFGCKDSSITRQPGNDDSRKHRGSTGLGVQGMSRSIQQHFVAWTAVQLDGDLVAHRP